MQSRKRQIENLSNEAPKNNEERRILHIKKTKILRNYDDKPNCPNIMEMSVEERKHYIKNAQNPYGWPIEYYEIYQRERMITDPREFNHLLCIDDISLFEKRNDQLSAVKNVRIQQFMNVNCIKSRHKEYTDLDEIKFSPDVYEFLRNSGINYVGEFEEYLEYQTEYNEEYNKKLQSIDEQYINTEDRFEQKIILGDDFEKYIAADYEILSKNQPNKYRVIIEIIRLQMGNLAQFVCIAGGFTLSMYIYEKYGYSIKFSDIDMFIHSCDENTANLIISKMEDITQQEIWQNDNVFVSCFNMNDLVDEDNKPYISFGTHVTLQIIKRLYTCPAQIILGFDVDCCCILTTLNANTYITERGAYSLRNGYNVLNFDRMSPSYEWRITKYNKRGLGIWIPFMEYFKNNTVFDTMMIDYEKQSSIIVRDLITTHIKKYVKFNSEVVDYFNIRKTCKGYTGEYVEFKKLNPGEQIINTFHRIVLEDPIEWYQKRSENTLDYISINHLSHNDIEINPDDDFTVKSAMNLARCVKAKNQGLRTIQTCRNFLSYINYILPGIFITGNIVRGAVCGVNDKGPNNRIIKLFYPNIRSNEEKLFVKFQIQKYKMLLYVKNALADEYELDHIINCNELGRIIFTESDDFMSITEEENFVNFLRIHSEKEFRCSMLKFNKNSNVAFIPSDFLYNLINLNDQSYQGDFLEMIKNHKYIRKAMHFLKIVIGDIYIKDLTVFTENEYEKIYGNKLFIHYHYRKIKENKIVKDTINFINMYPKQLETYLSLRDLHMLEIKGMFRIDIVDNYGEDFREDVLFHNDKYIASEYSFNLLKYGLTNDDINEKKAIVYDTAVHEQFIP